MTKRIDHAADCDEAADIERRSGGSRTTVATLVRSADYIRQLEGLVGEAVPGMKADSTYPDKAVSGPADKWLNTASALGLMEE